MAILVAKSGGILAPIANILGFIMNAIFEGLSAIRIENIGLCIIIFTIIVYMLMLPMTIKQQKFSRMSGVMNPEIQKVQAKYKGKNDQASMMKMREETQLIYEKYGTSPTGGCLGSLIQFPILFALWPVVRDVAAYVPAVKEASEQSLARMNRFIIYDITNTPGAMFKEATTNFSVVAIIAAVAIPFLSGLSQWISSKLMQKSTQKNSTSNNNQAMNSMNTMMNVMPIMSVVMCFSMPIGLGIYWIASAVVRTIQQVIIDKKLDKKPMEELIKENIEKAAKKREKKGAVIGSTINSMAQKSTRQIEEPQKKTVSINEVNSYKQNAKPGSLAAKANMVSDFNKNKQ